MMWQAFTASKVYFVTDVVTAGVNVSDRGNPTLCPQKTESPARGGVTSSDHTIFRILSPLERMLRCKPHRKPHNNFHPVRGVTRGAWVRVHP